MTPMKGYLKFASKHPVLVGWIVYIILTSVTVAFSLWMLNVEKSNAKYDVERRSLEIADNLEGALTNSVIATSMIAYLVENDIVKDNFDSLSRGLLEQYRYIDALQLLEGTTIVNTYPLEGNESTIGFDISTNRSHALESMKSITRNQLYFEGPFNLRQGGTGIVGRRPIYKNGELWGFTAVVIRSETLIAAVGVDQSGWDDKYQYQITKINPDSSLTNLFDHQSLVESGVYHSTFIPIGDWNIIVKARYPLHILRTTPLFILGLFLSVVIGIMAWFMASEPKKLERMVHEKTESLEGALSELEDQKSRLLIINAELKQFAFVASHDLQEPLRMISSFLSKLDQSYSTKLDDKARKYIHFAVDGANRMRSLIIDLLEYSQVGEAMSKLEHVDLNDSLKEVKQLNRDVITAKSATIISDNLPLMLGYRVPLIQMLSNLVQNAIKYSKEGVPPHIQIIARETKTTIEIKVADNGIGIDSEYFEKIFVIFQRLHPTSEYGGTGIGLAIVKKVVDMHNGTIRVESTPGVGTTFHLSLKKSTERNARIQT
jgi:signal transduction histidine kinase